MALKGLSCTRNGLPMRWSCALLALPETGAAKLPGQSFSLPGCNPACPPCMAADLGCMNSLDRLMKWPVSDMPRA